MKKRKKKKVYINGFTRMVFFFTAILLISMPFVLVLTTSIMGQISYGIEKKTKEIKLQEKTNESLNMAINELASLDKIQEVAESQGLSYNNGNIKSIEDKE